MVVAETKAQALDAAEAVEVDYEELPFVAAFRGRDARPARRWCGTRCRTTSRSRPGSAIVEATDQAFARGRPCGDDGLPYRPRHRRAARAARRRSAITTRRPAATRSMPAAAARCGRSASSSRCSASRRTICACFPTMSAAISARATASFVEFGLVLWAARKLGRPVKFTATRSEAFLSDYQGRDLVTKVELALDARTAASSPCAPTNISNVGARCVSLSPLSKGSGLITGSYDIPAATLRAVRRVHQHHADPGLSQLRPAGGHLRHRAADRHRRGAARLRPHRAAPQESDPPEGHALPQRGRHALRQRPLRRATWTGRWRSPTGRVSTQRRREAKKRGKLLGPRPCQLRRILDRRAEASRRRDHGAAGRRASMW